MKKLDLKTFSELLFNFRADNLNVDDYVLSSDLIEFFENNKELYIKFSKSAQNKIKKEKEKEEINNLLKNGEENEEL